MSTIGSKRISKSASFEVNGNIDEVFPLFGPVREKEWAGGWDPEIVFSTTGIVDLHMIFKTRAHDQREKHYIWIVSQFRPEAYFIEYTVFTHLRVWHITVECKPLLAHTLVTVKYMYTATTEEGGDLNRRAMEEMFAHDLRDWQRDMNEYMLRTHLTLNP